MALRISPIAFRTKAVHGTGAKALSLPVP